MAHNENPTKGPAMYVFTDDEKTDLDRLVADLRATAKNIETMAHMKKSNHAPIESHTVTILDRYRDVILLKERELFRIIQKYRDRK